MRGRDKECFSNKGLIKITKDKDKDKDKDKYKDKYKDKDRGWFHFDSFENRHLTIFPMKLCKWCDHSSQCVSILFTQLPHALCEFDNCLTKLSDVKKGESSCVGISLFRACLIFRILCELDNQEL